MKNTKYTDFSEVRGSHQGKVSNRKEIQYQHEILSLIAQIRCLEDDLAYQEAKNNQMHSLFSKHITDTEQMHIKMLQMENELSHLRENQQLNRRKNQQILKYQHNIQTIGQEIATINSCLINKNAQYQLLMGKLLEKEDQNTGLNNEIKSLQDKQSKLNKIVFEIIQSIKEDFQPFFSSKEIIKNLQLIKQYFVKIKEKNNNLKEYAEKLKRQSSLMLSDQRAKITKLQYQIKLQVERGKDYYKQQNIIQVCAHDNKVEEIIQDLLKKQDQLENKIYQIQRQRDNIQNNLENQIFQLQNSYSFQLQKLNKTLDVKNKQIHNLKRQLQKSKQKNRVFQQKYQKMLEETNRQSGRDSDADINFMKRLRYTEEESKLTKLKLNQLQNENRILRSEIQIMRQ